MHKYIIISLISLILYTIYNINNNIEQFSISSRDWYDSCNNDYDCKLDFEDEYDPNGNSDCIKYLSCGCEESIYSPVSGQKVCMPNLKSTDPIYVINTNSAPGEPYEKKDLKQDEEFIGITDTGDGNFYENVKQWLINNPEWTPMTAYSPTLSTFPSRDLPTFYSSIHLTYNEARNEEGLTIRDYMNRDYNNQEYTVYEVDFMNPNKFSEGHQIGGTGDNDERCRSKNNINRCNSGLECMALQERYDLEYCVNTGELNQPCRPEYDARGRCEPRFTCDTSNNICVNAGEEFEPCIDTIGMRRGRYGCHDDTMSCEEVPGRYPGEVEERCIKTGLYHGRCRSQKYSNMFEVRRCDDEFRDGTPVVCRIKEDVDNPFRYPTCRKRKRNFSFSCASNPRAYHNL